MKKQIPLPLKGNGQYRHCYHGQEANLHKLLADKYLSLEDFNQFWDSYLAINRDHERSLEEKNTEYREAIAQRMLRMLADATTIAERSKQPWERYTDDQLREIYQPKQSDSHSNDRKP
jgi:hypothetical protein